MFYGSHINSKIWVFISFLVSDFSVFGRWHHNNKNSPKNIIYMYINDAEPDYELRWWGRYLKALGFLVMSAATPRWLLANIVEKWAALSKCSRSLDKPVYSSSTWSGEESCKLRFLVSLCASEPRDRQIWPWHENKIYVTAINDVTLTILLYYHMCLTSILHNLHQKLCHISGWRMTKNLVFHAIWTEKLRKKSFAEYTHWCMGTTKHIR